MPTLGSESVASVDLGIYIVAIVLYIVLVWVPTLACLYWALKYPGLEFRWHWWKFRRQYIYVEIMFRTHVILGGGAFTVMLGEGYQWYLTICAVLIFGILNFFLKWVSNHSKSRIPGTTAIAMVLNQTIHGTKTSRGEMKTFLSQMSDNSIRPSVQLNKQSNHNAANYQSMQNENDHSEKRVP